MSGHNIRAFMIMGLALLAGYCFFGMFGVGCAAILVILVQLA